MSSNNLVIKDMDLHTLVKKKGAVKVDDTKNSISKIVDSQKEDLSDLTLKGRP